MTSPELDDLIARQDILGLGVLADQRRRQRHGDRATFVRVQHVPASRMGDPLEVLPGAGELRLTGGVEGGREVTRVVEWAVEAAGSIPVTGFSLDALAAVCDHETASLARLLADLRQAGLAMVSEVRFETPRVREWLEASGGVGLDVGRLTVARPVDDDGDGSTLARQVASWGEAVSHVHAFAPLPRVMEGLPTTGYGDVRRVALARLLVDNIGSIQVDWSAYGPKLAQVALIFGADDLDAVSPIESLEQGPRRTPLEDVTRNIKAAAMVPIERDGCFEVRKL